MSDTIQPGSAAQRPAPSRVSSPTPPFLWAAVLVAALPGFALGGALFGHHAGIWWAAAAQAHGHAQLFGWAGLLVIGVTLHFLPRLRGTSLQAPWLVPWVLSLYGGGIVLRVVVQPLAPFAPALAPLLPLSALLELAGALLAGSIVVRSVLSGVPLAQRPGFIQVVPWLAATLVGLLLGLVANLLAMLGAATDPLALAPLPWQPATLLLGLYGFLVCISVAMSARTLPLYLRVRPASASGLNIVLALLVAGLILRLVAAREAPPWLGAVGQLVLAAALVGACWQVDAPLLRTRAAILAEARRRAEAYGQAPRPLTESERGYLPAELLVRSAYAWLLVAALLLVVGGLAAPLGFPAPPADAERHAVGAGFITLLIFGVGVYLLPGFRGRRIASFRLVWATLWLGNLAALLRVAPILLLWAMGAVGSVPTGRVLLGLASLAGVLDLIAVLLFALNLWRTWR